MPAPARRLIYHITHVDTLVQIVSDGALWSDSVMVARGGPAVTIGMSSIKLRRLRELPVKCHPGDYVGEYVPFYFCPRSIMLYLLHMGNHPELTYREGQGPIVHLEADLRESVAWADGEQKRWAFTLSNAGAFYAEFRNDLGRLNDVDWDAVANNDFRSSEVKEGKQAEFLMRETFPWRLVRCVGVQSDAMQQRVVRVLDDAGAAHRPPVVVRRDWYF